MSFTQIVLRDRPTDEIDMCGSGNAEYMKKLPTSLINK